jgi:hypothetical protein
VAEEAVRELRGGGELGVGAAVERLRQRDTRGRRRIVMRGCPGDEKCTGSC